ncbi:hypothetical protein CARUB_v10026382mg [Capsella rubella]|uniref:Putative plant transposon protein domain-containing protein n=1 Tax=Capsella rubella TaxID=81985 RepID=R0GQ60_9BRAS|nr:hypothetical protein CARUB_v10026382mg [Capsella rubella]
MENEDPIAPLHEEKVGNEGAENSSAATVSGTAPLHRIPKIEPEVSNKVNPKVTSQPPRKKQCTRGSTSKAKAKASTIPSRRLPHLAAARPSFRETEDVEEITAAQPHRKPDLSDSDVEEVDPSSFLTRYVTNQRLVAGRDRNYPELKTPSTVPFSSHFVSPQAEHRFQVLSKRQDSTGRIFNEMGILLDDCPQWDEVSKIMSTVSLLPTAIEADSFTENVVKEFYANLPEAENDDPEVLKVFVRGSLYEFSPMIINQLYQLPSPPYPSEGSQIHISESLNQVVSLLTDGRIRDWKRRSKRGMGDAMSLLHKICCQNWMPTVNLNALKAERSSLLFMVVKGRPVNFGKLAFDEIRACSSVVMNESSNLRLVLPNLIDQLLRFQRIVPSAQGDVSSAAPAKFRIEPKEMLPPRTSHSAAENTLTADLQHLHEFTQTMLQRLEGKFSPVSPVSLCF